MADRIDKRYGMVLIEYIAGVLIVFLFLVGVAFFSLRLRTSMKVNAQPKEQVQLHEIERLPRPNRFRSFRGERTLT